MLAAQPRGKRPDIRVRARPDRTLASPPDRLFQTMRPGPVAGVMVRSGSKRSRRAKSGRVTRAGRPARLEVRYRPVTRPPTPDQTAAPVRVSAVHVRETAPRPGPNAWRSTG